jgi:glycosyltransferase involved in cell wall biosynthesis
MKILISAGSYVFSDYLPAGEIQIANDIVNRLAGRGHKVYVFAPLADLKTKIPNIEVFEIGKYDFINSKKYADYLWNWWKYSVKSYLKCKELFRKERIDVVHHIRPAYPRKFSLCWKIPAPFIYGPISLPITGKGTSRRLRWEKSSLLNKIKSKMVDRLEMTVGQHLWLKTLSRAYCTPVSVTKTLDLLPKRSLQQAPIIPLGVDTRKFNCVNIEKTSQSLIIFFAGTIESYKGIKYLLKGMQIVQKSYPDVKLILAGAGREFEHFKALAEKLGLNGNVEFLGPVDFNNMPKLYQKCDIFCLPSMFEAFGMSIIQAMSCGKPVVSTRVGGIPEIIKEEKSGMLVPPGDAESLACAIIRLAKNKTLRQKMGVYNRKLCTAKYDWDVIVGRFEEIYEKAIRDWKRNDEREIR